MLISLQIQLILSFQKWAVLPISPHQRQYSKSWPSNSYWLHWKRSSSRTYWYQILFKESWNNTTGCTSLRQFLPLQKFFIWYIRLFMAISTKAPIHVCISHRISQRVLFGVQLHVKYIPGTNDGNWSAPENIPFVPFVLQFNGSVNTSFPSICQHLNRAVAGRSRYNCHCEGLLVSFQIVTSQN